jgi:hypothetical protein
MVLGLDPVSLNACAHVKPLKRLRELMALVPALTGKVLELKAGALNLAT